MANIFDFSNNNLNVGGGNALSTPKKIEIARQFEAIFVQIMLKKMQETNLSGAEIDPAMAAYKDMQTQNFSQTIASDLKVASAKQDLRNLWGHAGHDAGGSLQGAAKKAIISLDDKVEGGLGIGKSIYELLSKVKETKDINDVTAAEKTALIADGKAILDKVVLAIDSTKTFSSIQEKKDYFISRLTDSAEKISEVIGIPKGFMLAQAALETGWGSGELKKEDGSPTYNIFNIKAGKNWKGETVSLPVTEFINGKPVKEIASFRVYQSYEEGFKDYASLLMNNSRYKDVLNIDNVEDFARGLQVAGYATDPEYADKIISIVKKNGLG